MRNFYVDAFDALWLRSGATYRNLKLFSKATMIVLHFDPDSSFISPLIFERGSKSQIWLKFGLSGAVVSK